MSSESSEWGNITSTEDIELMEFARSPDDYSGSEQSPDSTASYGWSTKQNETDADKADDVVITFLDTSDENHHEFDMERGTLSSLEGVSPGELSRTRRLCSDQNSSVLTRKAVSLEACSTRKVLSLDHPEKHSSRKVSSLNTLEGLSVRRVSSLDPPKRFETRVSSMNSLEGPSTRRVSSLDPLAGPSTRTVSPLDPLGPSTRRVSSLDPLAGPSTRTVSPLDPLGPSTRRVSSLDALKGPSTRRVSSFDPLEGPSTRRVSSFDPLEGPSTRRVSSFDPLEGPSTRRVSSFDPLEGPSTGRVSFLDPLEGPSTRRVSSLDPLEGSSTRRVSSFDPLEGPSTRRASSFDPLEGPSSRTVWFSDSERGSLTSICKSHDSETEINESINNEPPTELGTLAWLKSLLRRYSRQIRHSKYFLLFHVALLALPCSAGYMGSKYWKLCNGCVQLPFLVYLMGIFGVWIVTLRIAAILSKRYFAPYLTGREFHTWLVSISLVAFLFLIVGMATIFMCEPVFIFPVNEEFCNKVFYNYAYYLNVVVPLVFLLMMLIHVPGCFDPAEDD